MYYTAFFQCELSILIQLSSPTEVNGHVFKRAQVS